MTDKVLVTCRFLEAIWQGDFDAAAADGVTVGMVLSKEAERLLTLPHAADSLSKRPVAWRIGPFGDRWTIYHNEDDANKHLDKLTEENYQLQGLYVRDGAADSRGGEPTSAGVWMNAYADACIACDKLKTALKHLTFAARTSGGVAGRDNGLCAAGDEAEQVLSSKLPMVSTPGGEPTREQVEAAAIVLWSNVNSADWAKAHPPYRIEYLDLATRALKAALSRPAPAAEVMGDDVY